MLTLVFFSTVMLMEATFGLNLIKAIQLKSGSHMCLTFWAQKPSESLIVLLCVECLHFTMFNGVTKKA